MTLTREQKEQISQVWRTYESEVEKAAKTAITGYVQSGRKPEDGDEASYWAGEDNAVIGDGVTQPIGSDEIERRLAILKQDDDFFNVFYHYAQALPDDRPLGDVDQTLRIIAYDHLGSMIEDWFDAQWQ